MLKKYKHWDTLITLSNLTKQVNHRFTQQRLHPSSRLVFSPELKTEVNFSGLKAAVCWWEWAVGWAWFRLRVVKRSISHQGWVTSSATRNPAVVVLCSFAFKYTSTTRTDPLTAIFWFYSDYIQLDLYFCTEYTQQTALRCTSLWIKAFAKWNCGIVDTP